MLPAAEVIKCAWCEKQTPLTKLVAVAAVESEFLPAMDELWCTECCADQLAHEMTFLHPDEFLPQAD